MATEREEQIERLIRRYREQLEQSLPEGPLDINQIEDLAGKLGQEVQRELTERLVYEEVEQEEGNQTVCPCGGTARFRGRNAQEWVTAAGRIRVRRAYFYCAACGKGHCPADLRLQRGHREDGPANPAGSGPPSKPTFEAVIARLPLNSTLRTGPLAEPWQSPSNVKSSE